VLAGCSRGVSSLENAGSETVSRPGAAVQVDRVLVAGEIPARAQVKEALETYIEMALLSRVSAASVPRRVTSTGVCASARRIEREAPFLARHANGKISAPSKSQPGEGDLRALKAQSSKVYQNNAICFGITPLRRVCFRTAGTDPGCPPRSSDDRHRSVGCSAHRRKMMAAETLALNAPDRVQRLPLSTITSHFCEVDGRTIRVMTTLDDWLLRHRGRPIEQT
jgi:hypothetical protein